MSKIPVIIDSNDEEQADKIVNVLKNGNPWGIQISKQTINAPSRKLTATWTLEAVEDLEIHHHIDIENEMWKALSAEIDKEIMDGILGTKNRSK